MQSKSLANLLRILSTPRRVEILRFLLEAEAPVMSKNVASFMALDDNSASFNLMALAKVGLVLRTPSGPYVFYSPNRILIREVFEYFNIKEQV